MCQVYLLIGGNLGDRNQNILSAIKSIQKNIGKIVLQSSVYETKAWGEKQQPDYLNLVILITTNLKPIEILNKTQQIEKELGRSRIVSQKWGARTMDIDILFYNDSIIETERLTIPHPLINKRMFVLLPLMEISPDFIHPVSKEKIKNLYLNCEDELEVKKI